MALHLPPVSPTTPSLPRDHSIPHDDAGSDADTASQRSISLDSPPNSRRQSAATQESDDAHRFLANPGAFLRGNDKRESNQFTVDTDFSSDADEMSLYKHRMSVTGETPNTTAPPSIFEEEPLTATKENIHIPLLPPVTSSSAPSSQPAQVPATAPTPTTAITTYPPTPPTRDDTVSISSLTSTTSSRKARPESLLVVLPKGPLVLGIALVDFNHLVGPRIEWSKGEIFDDEEVAKILPFLALPDGAYLSSEDYSYFHLVPPGPNTTTIFGISQVQPFGISAKALLVKDPDVTRSTVQKAVVVLAFEMSLYKHRMSVTGETPNTTAPPSIFEEEPLTATKEYIHIPLLPPVTSSSAPSSPPAQVPATAPMPTTAITTYPPTPPTRDDTVSISSLTSTTSSRKARPESLLVVLPKGPLVLGIALVDFNHLVGPRIEWSKGEIFDDEEVAKILPFLALPDGAHLSSEDYSYFHLVPPGPNTTTIFGISFWSTLGQNLMRSFLRCNQQISAKALLVKDPDVTRSTVQKAVVVLASKPVFGPIRDKLRVVTTALFQQRDFSDTSILDDFAVNLEPSLRGQLTESGLYMGLKLTSNRREFVHTFRHRTLILVKALILQKRIMFFGHPVERLCTYQYSLISLLPGLLQTLEDCGSPPLANRAPTLSRPNSLKTSDHKSMMTFMGLPLDVFGKDAFFQPYLPLQQLDMIKDTPSWLCGSTNSIVTQQKDIDLLVDTETGTVEFRDPKLERLAGLTAADRKWMDDIVTDVNVSWDDADPKTSTLQFKGSDDYLRTKFEEYISAALSSVKYRDFVMKGEGSGVLITGGTGGDVSNTDDFNPLWISEFRNTNAYAVWDRITDPLIFDIVEPRHPCTEKPSVVADIGLRLSEGIQDLKLEQQLAPAREAVARTLATGSTSFFKAVEGARERWQQRRQASTINTSSSASIKSDTSELSTPIEVSKSEVDGHTVESPKPASRPFSLLTSFTSPTSASSEHSRNGSTPGGTGTTLNGAVSTASATATAAANNLSTWGVGIGSFFSSRLARAKSSDGPIPQIQGSPAPASTLSQGKPLSPVASPLSSLQTTTILDSTPPVSSKSISGLTGPDDFVVPEPVNLDLRKEEEVRTSKVKVTETAKKEVHEDEDEGQAYSGIAL
ncbi:Late secretory pathway protein AVL9 [Leucoagaricus sp. SymC.cos]|nr:Late secretory pathway protein AVL9 [Leucoagaricus sp. SymC.cos]